MRGGAAIRWIHVKLVHNLAIVHKLQACGDASTGAQTPASVEAAVDNATPMPTAERSGTKSGSQLWQVPRATWHGELGDEHESAGVNIGNQPFSLHVVPTSGNKVPSPF